MPAIPLTESIGARLRVERKSLGLTQQELAELAGVSVRFVHEVEHGKRSAHVGKLIDIGAVLGLELTFVPRLTGGGDSRQANT